MNIAATDWVFKLTGIDPLERLVLYTLAQQADDAAHANVSTQALADMTSMSRASICRKIERCVTLGLIERDGAQGLATRYRLALGDASRNLPHSEARPTVEEPRNLPHTEAGPEVEQPRNLPQPEAPHLPHSEARSRQPASQGGTHLPHTEAPLPHPEARSRARLNALKPKERPKNLTTFGSSDSNNADLGPLGVNLVTTIATAMNNGRKSWDLTNEAQKLWDRVIEHKVPGVVPQHVVGEVIKVIYGEDLTPKDWARAGRLCRMYGKTALFGVVEAIKHDVPLEEGGLWAYATKVAETKQRTLRERRGE